MNAREQEQPDAAVEGQAVEGQAEGQAEGRDAGPTAKGGPSVASELLSEHQGPEPPFGPDMVPPVPVERHGRHWIVRDPRVERQDTDLDTDVPHPGR